MGRRAIRRIGDSHGQHMFIDMVVMHVVQMAVMQVVDVIAVLDRRMAAPLAMDVAVPRVNLVIGLLHIPSVECASAFRTNSIMC